MSSFFDQILPHIGGLKKIDGNENENGPSTSQDHSHPPTPVVGCYY